MKSNEKFFAFSIITITIIFAMLNRKVISAIHRAISEPFFLPVIPLTPRKCDNFGCGNFGASRDGGTRKHMGQDYLAKVGQPVFAPISGTFSTGSAYASGQYRELRYCKITSETGAVSVAIMYAKPGLSSGERVEAGQVIGEVQSLQGRYPGINNHIHVEVKVSGIKVDPAPYFKKTVA